MPQRKIEEGGGGGGGAGKGGGGGGGMGEGDGGGGGGAGEGGDGVSSRRVATLRRRQRQGFCQRRSTVVAKWVGGQGARVEML